MESANSTGNKMVRNRATVTRLMHWARSITLTLAIVACVFPDSVPGADLRIVAPNAVKEVISDAAARYERASGNRTLFTWGGSEAIAKRVGDGEVFDVVLNTPQNLD